MTTTGLGVGVVYNGVLEGFVQNHGTVLDYVSVIPERFWRDLGRDAVPRFCDLRDDVMLLESLGDRYPLVAHGIGLSIASGSTFDLEHLRQLASWHTRYGFRWISEHLSAVRVQTGGSIDHHAGLAIPLPWDEDVLAMLCERVGVVQDILGCQILLENGVVHTPVPDTDMSEVEFLNELCARSGCALLLDLHNLHVNAVNLELDPDAFLDALDCRHVREIHIAGGNRLYGVYLDSHAGASPPEVWRLLAQVLPRCPDIEGVTFEFHESYYPELGVEGVLAELSRARAIWDHRYEVQTCHLPTSSAHSAT
jgi:uncharacterized protein